MRRTQQHYDTRGGGKTTFDGHAVLLHVLVDDIVKDTEERAGDSLILDLVVLFSAAEVFAITSFTFLLKSFENRRSVGDNRRLGNLSEICRRKSETRRSV